MDKWWVGGWQTVWFHQEVVSCSLSFLSLKCRSASLTCPGFLSLYFVMLITTDPYFQQGWFHFQKSLYYISSLKNTWRLSRKYCLQKGADLTIINSRAEQVGDGAWIWGRGGRVGSIWLMEAWWFLSTIKDFLENFKMTLWIGLVDKGSSGRWRWVDGTPLNERCWAPSGMKFMFSTN